MSQNSPIEWTEATWNPVRGCVQVSPGCANCYAKTFAERWRGVPGHAYEQGFDLRLVPEKLDEPLRTKKPTTYFVNSMSDLFQEGVPDQFIVDVFGIMALAHWHTFQVLTKRPERMRSFLAAGDHGILRQFMLLQQNGGTSTRPVFRALDIKRRDNVEWRWPLPNVWLGVSVENQHFADERIPLLLQTPAAVRFISAEPLLEGVDIGLSTATCACCPRWSSRWVNVGRTVTADFPMVLLPEHAGNVVTPTIHRAASNQHGALSVNGIGLRPAEFDALPALDWVIVGGESGHGARPFDVAWARSIVSQCQAAGVPVFVKQLGANIRCGDQHFPFPPPARYLHTEERLYGVKLRSPKGGDPAEWPEDLRVREMPRAG